MIDVSIIVVTYKGRLDVIKACFDSVYLSKGVNYELIVVDNGQNQAVKGLINAYDGATLIENTRNRGFAYAVNQGMKKSKGRYILLLNPDVQFEADVLAKMITHLDADPEVGIASSLIKYKTGEIQPSIRRFPTLIDQIHILLKIPHFRKTKAISNYMMEDADPHNTQDVDSIMGAFMWMRPEVVQDIGGFDEQYFLWFEEVDYCRMAYVAGYKIRHYADVEIMHLKGHDFDAVPTTRKQRWMRSSLRKYTKKHLGLKSYILLWILNPLFIMAGYIAAIIKRR